MNEGGPPWGFGARSKVDAAREDAVMFGWTTPSVSGTSVIQTVPRIGVPLLSGVSLLETVSGSRGVMGKANRPDDTEIGPGDSVTVVVALFRSSRSPVTGSVDWMNWIDPMPVEL